jgi:hypothetical protein
MVWPLGTAVTPASIRTTCELARAMRIASSSEKSAGATAGGGLDTVAGDGPSGMVA